MVQMKAASSMWWHLKLFHVLKYFMEQRDNSFACIDAPGWSWRAVAKQSLLRILLTLDSGGRLQNHT